MDKIEIAYLFDLYGGLLTDNQRKMLSLFYDGDCSLGEISSQCGVSRQAVRDAVVKGETTLKNAEQRLGLLNRLRQIRQLAASAAEKIDESAPLKATLNQIISLTEG